MFVAAIAVTVFLFQIGAVIAAWRAVCFARTPQGAVGWVVFLLSAPVVGLLLYLFLGHHRYRGYHISRQTSERVIKGVRQFAEQNAPSKSPSVDPTPFEALADMPAVGGNASRVLVDGKQSFDAIFQAIDGAQNYVLVQFYIVRDDELGRALQGRMIAAAKRGAKVRFMTDAVGSNKLPASFYGDLKRGGVDVADPREGNGISQP